MLKSYLNTLPCSKFILIHDSLQQRDPILFEFLVKQHLNRNHSKVHYFVFEGLFKRTQKKYQNSSNIVLHDFVSDSQNWLDEGKDNNFESILAKLGENDVVIVDSLSNVILLYGLQQTYRIFNNLKNNKAIQQIIVVLHKDVIDGDYFKVCSYLENLSTLSMHINDAFMSDKKRIEYTYMKRGGKIISQIEEYRFEGENLITNKIEKLDPKKLLEKALPKAVNPEHLSTFRIGLTDEEKLSREKVVLPYLPEANEKSQEEGKIFYQLDDVDDWDEEDPDDDLDI